MSRYMTTIALRWLAEAVDCLDVDQVRDARVLVRQVMGLLPQGRGLHPSPSQVGSVEDEVLRAASLLTRREGPHDTLMARAVLEDVEARLARA